MKEIQKVLYSLWMVAGVIGFSAAMGWLIYRWQKYAKATTDKEKIELRNKVRQAVIILFTTLLILAGFVLYTLSGAAAGLTL